VHGDNDTDQGVPLIRPLDSAAEMAAASGVYRRAFGYAPSEAAIPPKLLLTLGRHGGLVLGAFAGTELVGFCYAFLARDPGAPELYLFSQSTAVLPEWQSTGVGRRLKWAQREYALAEGIELIRWTFDPLRARNAHVNFDVLGASSGTLLPDYYGVDAVGRDSGAASDRLLADWRLTAVEPTRVRVHSRLAPTVSAPGERGGEWLTVPADWDTYRAQVGPAEAERVRLAVRTALASAFASGQRAVSCLRIDSERAAYRLL
jgi:predicted GNAT superfamily acetyltransferase